jgi:hypothetical protein
MRSLISTVAASRDLAMATRSGPKTRRVCYWPRGHVFDSGTDQFDKQHGNGDVYGGQPPAWLRKDARLLRERNNFIFFEKYC